MNIYSLSNGLIKITLLHYLCSSITQDIITCHSFPSLAVNKSPMYIMTCDSNQLTSTTNFKQIGTDLSKINNIKAITIQTETKYLSLDVGSACSINSVSTSSISTGVLNQNNTETYLKFILHNCQNTLNSQINLKYYVLNEATRQTTPVIESISFDDTNLITKSINFHMSIHYEIQGNVPICVREVITPWLFISSNQNNILMNLYLTKITVKDFGDNVIS